MMMGPDPIRRMEERSVRFGIYHFSQGSFQGPGRAPPGRLPQLGKVANGVSGAARPARIRLEPELTTDSGGENGRGFTESKRPAGRDVVDLTRNPALDQGQVGVDHVVQAQVVPYRLGIALERGGPARITRGLEGGDP